MEKTRKSPAQQLPTLSADLLNTYLMTGLLVVAAFLIGVLFTEVRYLKKGPVAGTNTQPPVANQPTNPLAPEPPSVESLPEYKENVYALGSDNAPVTLIVHSDLECPFCKSFHPTTKRVLDEYPGKVRVVWQHYPLAFHANAQKAAEAAECTGKLAGNDGFWKYIDLYFERTTATGTGVAVEDMPALANEAAGVNAAAVKSCMESNEMAQKVKDQMAIGQAYVQGTPGTVLVTQDQEVEYISGAVPFEQLKATLDKYVK